MSKRFCILWMIALCIHGISETKTVNFTILSFNDVYEIVSDPNGRGGFAEMATLLNREREKAPFHITTVNGDFLSPCILSVFDKGAHRVELFNMMRVDVVSVGNHEFDFGPDVVLKRIEESQFPWLAANALGLDGSPFTGKQQTIVIDVDGIKVGFFGLITVETPELSSTEKKVCFTPLAHTARRMIQELKEEGAEVFVALTHLLVAEDLELAKEVPELHVILGGHDHDPITWYNDRTFVHKSGQNAFYLAKIDLLMEKHDDSNEVTVFPSWQLILNKGLEREPVVAKKVDELQRILQNITQEPVGTMGMYCDSLYSTVRSKENALGNLVADALRLSCQADVAVITGGIIRGGRLYRPGMPISLQDLLTELPFANRNVMVELSGSDIVKALENGVSQVEGKAGRFPQVSGMEFICDLNLSPGNRIRDVYVQGVPLDPQKTYRVATVDYLFNGGDGYSMFKGGKVLLSPLKEISLVNTVAEYMRDMPEIKSELEGRIVMKALKLKLDDPK